MTDERKSGISFRSAQTPVRNQGPRPTCAAFAVTAAHEWMRGAIEHLSEESCLWSATRLGATGGATSIRRGLEGIAADGQATRADWPYGNPPWPGDPPAPADDAAKRLQPGDWRALGRPTLRDLETVLTAGRAVLLSVRFVPDAWFGSSATGFVDAEPGSQVVDGHAVLAVGIVERADTDLVEFKNSWGEAWGDLGYGYMTSRYWDVYGKRAFALAQ